MLHKVKQNKDVIIGNTIYSCNTDGIVDLPVRIENQDITPIEVKEVKKDDNKKVVKK